MASELNGATEPGPDNAWPSTPGEFATRWNRLTEEERTLLVRDMVRDAEHAAVCRVLGVRRFDSIDHLRADVDFDGTPAVFPDDPGRC